MQNPNKLDKSDDKDKDKGMDMWFTADGLVYVDKDGNAMQKVWNEDESDDSGLNAFSEDIDSSESEIDDADADHYDPNLILMVSTRIQVNYCVKEQFSEKAAWYNGVVAKVNKQANNGSVMYDVT